MNRISNTMKYYFVMKTEWAPSDKTSAFMPLVLDLIKSENIEVSKYDNLAKKVEEKFDFKMSGFILKPILNKMVDKGFATYSKERHTWTFNKDTFPNSNFENTMEEYNKQSHQLVLKFQAFCTGLQEMSFDEAENILYSFIENNTVSVGLYEGKLYSNSPQENAYNQKEINFWLLSQYIKNLKSAGEPLFDFFTALCEGALIKSFILNEGLQGGSFTNKRIYVDAPIIFRLLGYYGEYEETEYKYLFDCLKEQKCTLFVFDDNYNEVLNVLEKAKEYVESDLYNDIKANEVCRYFRMHRKTKKDIGEEIVLLEKKLNSIGIQKHSDGSEWTRQEFIENEKQIKEQIIKIYSEKKYNHSDLPIDAIGVDATSAVRVYALRGNNKAQLFKDAPCFYISNNIGFIKAVHQYNSDNYGKTISPIIDVNLVGLIACSEHPQNVTEITRNRMLAFCNHHFKPSKRVRDKFSEFLEKQKGNNELTDIEYLQLTNETTVAEHLFKVTMNNPESINENTTRVILDKVRGDYIVDVEISYKKELQEKDELHKKELQLKDNEQTELKISHAKEEYYTSAHKTRIAFYAIYTLLLVITLSSTVFSFVNGWNNNYTIFYGLPSLVFTLLGIIIFFVGWPQKRLCKALNHIKIKVANKHGVDVDKL